MTTSPVRVGWIGCGRMGFALAGRLLDAGYDLTVYNRTRSKAEPLAERGAKIVDTPVELADRDVVLSCVAASQDLIDVVAQLTADPDETPKIVIDISTVSMDASAQARAKAENRGSQFLAAPVSGNPKVAAAGRLTLAVSGPRAACEEARPLLDRLGSGVSYVGEGEVARLVKICHNVFLGVVIQSLCEITLLAEQGGASRAGFLEFLNASVLGSTFTRYKSPALVNLDFTPTFTMPLLAKDIPAALATLGAPAAPAPRAAMGHRHPCRPGLRAAGYSPARWRGDLPARPDSPSKESPVPGRTAG
jgi:3-hydroxyisobutyrate dehydrogenase-like beta-hydroxyacid dehydrogenase